MAGEIKGITIEFRGDTTKLDKALRQVNSETKSIDNELRKVNNALKFNPGNVDLLKQKQQLLGDKIKQTKDKLEALKQAQAQMDASGVDKTSAKYREVQREIITSENKLKNFNAELKRVEAAASPLGQASTKVADFGEKAQGAGNKLMGISKAAAVVEGAIGAMTYKAGAWADDLNTMSSVYSLSTKDLQKYALSAELVDTSVDTIAKSHVRLEKNMLSASQGSKNQAEAFEALGVQYKNADGSLRDSDAVWQDVISSLGKMENETERDAYAMQLMGKSAAELNPLIEDGGETYKRTAEIFKKYGLDYIDQDTLDKANDFNDRIDEIKAIGLITFQSLGAELAGYLAPALETVVGWIGKLAEWMSGLSPKTMTIIAAVAGVLAVLGPVLVAIGKLSMGISGILKLASMIGPLLSGLSLPIIGIVAGVAALVAVLVSAYRNSESFRNAVQTLGHALGTVLKAGLDVIVGLFKALWPILQAIGKVVGAVLAPVIKTLAVVFAAIGKALQPVIAAFKAVKSWVEKTGLTFDSVSKKFQDAGAKIREVGKKLAKPFQDAWYVIKGIFDKISGVINTIKGALDFGKTGSSVKGRSASIQFHAAGGIFTRPTLLGATHVVGEAGAEAVLPLKALWNQMDKMTAEMGGNTTYNTFNITVDGAQDPVNIAEDILQALKLKMRTA